MITLKYLRDQRTASKSLNDGEMHKQSQMKTMKHHRAYPQQAQNQSQCRYTHVQ